MNIKKLGSSLAAICILTLSSPVMAGDCLGVAKDIEDWAKDLVFTNDRVAADGITIVRGWVDPAGVTQTKAIWQFKGTGAKGDAVHAKLAKQLFEERADYDPNTMPPYKGAKTEKGGNLAAGAANMLRDGNYEGALLHLQNFWDTIEYNAKLNSENPDAETQADDQQAEALRFMGQIDAVLGCMTP